MMAVEEMMSDSEQQPQKKTRAPKSGSIPRTELDGITQGIETWEKASFHMVGPRDGVRLAVPKTRGISRAYFYAAGDYDLIPEHPAIKVFQPDERKERKLGGVMAEIDFSHGVEMAKQALGLLVEKVRAEEAKAAASKPAQPETVSTDVGEEPSEPTE